MSSGACGPERRGIGPTRGHEHELEGVARVPGTAGAHRDLFDPVEAECGRAPTLLAELVRDVVDAGAQARSAHRRPAERGADVVGVEIGVVPQRLDSLAERAVVAAGSRPSPTTHRRTRRRGRRPASSPPPAPATDSAGLRPLRSATSRAVASGEPRPSSRPDTTSAIEPITWADTSATDHPSQRVGRAQSDASSGAMSSPKDTSSASRPGTTSVRDSVITSSSGVHLHAGCMPLY